MGILFFFTSFLDCNTDCYRYNDSKPAYIYFIYGGDGDTVKITQCKDTMISCLKLSQTYGVSGVFKIKDQGTVHITINRNEKELFFSPNKIPYHIIDFESNKLNVTSTRNKPYFE